MSQNLNNPTTSGHRDYGSTSSSVNAITTMPDVNFSGFSPTEFMSLSENIALNIQLVQSSWAQLDKILRIIGTQRDKQATRDKVHSIQAQTNTKIQTTSKDLQRLTAVVRRGDKQQKLQLEKLTTDFSTVVKKYSASQQKIATKMKQIFLQSVHAQQQDEEAASGEENMSVLERQQLMAQKQKQIEANLQFEQDLMKDKEIRIKQIEDDVLDVNAIMRELSSLVNQQGEEISTIESSIDHSASAIASGTDEIRRAAEYRARYRRKIFILLAIAVIIGIIVTGIIVGNISR